MDNLDLIIRDRQTELNELQGELTDALTGIDSPDYTRAARIERLIYRVEAEIRRLEKLRRVANPSKDFSAYFSQLLTDDTVTMLELWVGVKDYWRHDVTVRLLVIQKWKSGHTVTCTLRLSEPLPEHVNSEHTASELQRLGWTRGRGGRTFRFKARIKNPYQFDVFSQRMAVTMLEALGNLWAQRQQYFRFK